MTSMRQKKMLDELKESAADTGFVTDFLDRSSARLSSVESRIYHLTMVNYVIIALLFVGVFTKGKSIHLLDMNASEVYNIKEFALFVSASIILFISMMKAHVSSISDDLIACVRFRYGDQFSSKIKEILPGDPFGSRFSYLVYVEGGGFPGFLSKLFHSWSILLILAILALYIIIIVFVHVYLLLDVLRDPSVSRWVSWSIFGYVVLVDILSLFLGMAHIIPFRYVDYRYSELFNEIEKGDRKNYFDVCDGISVWSFRPKFHNYLVDGAILLFVTFPLFLVMLNYLGLIDGKVSWLEFGGSFVFCFIVNELVAFIFWRMSLESYVVDNYDTLATAVELLEASVQGKGEAGGTSSSASEIYNSATVDER